MEGFESEINNLNLENEKVTNEKDQLNKKISELNESLKNLEKKKERENEGLYEKIKILQNTVDLYAKKSNESDSTVNILETKLSEQKFENSDLKSKNDNLVYEMEINYKNLKNNFLLEKNLKDLTEENDKLISQIKNLQNSEDYKVKYLQLENYLKELEGRFNISKKNIEDLNLEKNKLSNENFEKFQKINNLENEIKLKTHKIDEIEKEKSKYKKINEELDSKIKNFEYLIKTINANYENQIKELKKEIDKLVKVNDQQKKDILDYKNQIDVKNIFFI